MIYIAMNIVYCKISSLEQAGIAKRQAAANYLQALEELDLLEVIKVGKENYYINKKLFKILKL